MDTDKRIVIIGREGIRYDAVSVCPMDTSQTAGNSLARDGFVRRVDS